MNLRLLPLFSFLWFPVLPGLAQSPEESTRVFEYRIYTVHADKMPNMLARFRDHTCEIFARLGAENIGYWVETEPADGMEPRLHYIIAHPSRAAARDFWATFKDDPAWQAARQASTADGKIVKSVDRFFMAPVDFSAIK